MDRRHQVAIDKTKTLLMIIDIQERLCAPLKATWLERTISRIGLMALFARNENIPVTVTEQYPEGLGPTRKDVLGHLAGIPFERFAKNVFDATSDKNVLAHLNRHKDKNIILTGMETHICVYLTTLGLLKHGFNVFVPHDATIARTRDNHKNGLNLAEESGAIITNTETLVFQMMQRSEGTTFKAVSKYLKAQNQQGPNK